ncbi:MAG: hypothetical protein ABR902_04965 [Candidatus Korobacteraceae bacterium]|jgi:hypothetical protein
MNTVEKQPSSIPVTLIEAQGRTLDGWLHPGFYIVGTAVLAGRSSKRHRFKVSPTRCQFDLW